MATKVSTVRLGAADLRNIATIVKSGAANTDAGAIRLALYEAAEKREFDHPACASRVNKRG